MELGHWLAPLTCQWWEYYQVISQVYTYVQKCHTRYFYIVTDKFLVCYRCRVNQNGIAILGSVEESPKIRWDTVGVPGQPDILTVALALWYLHILASTDNPSNHLQLGGLLPSLVWSMTGDCIGEHPTFFHWALCRVWHMSHYLSLFCIFSGCTCILKFVTFHSLS
jgi:hypothetical protein